MDDIGQIIIAVLGSACSIWAVLKDRYWLLLLLTFIYMIFGILLLICQNTELANLHTFFVNTNFAWLHAVGITFILGSIFLPLMSKKQRKNLLKKIKILVSKDPFKVYEKEVKETEMWSEQEIQQELLRFSEDANEIIVLGGSGKFLVKPNNKSSEQYNLIKADANKYKILLNHKAKGSPPIELLYDLVKEGAKINGYSTSNKSLRGRLKENVTGKSALLYNKTDNSHFRLNKLDDQYIVNLLYDEIIDVINDKGTNLFIKHICFDLAGVFCSGDIKDFYQKLNGLGGLFISAKDSDHLCVDEKLNLDKDYDIISHLNSKFTKQNQKTKIKNEKDKIIGFWNNTWKINEPIRELAIRLKSLGYTIAISSNCDYLNGEHYKLHRYFEDFDTFLSYECGFVKPQEEYFKKILNEYNCQPYEVLFIDDHRENTKIAKQLGFETIFVNRGRNDDDKANFIQQELRKINIYNQ